MIGEIARHTIANMQIIQKQIRFNQIENNFKKIKWFQQVNSTKANMIIITNNNYILTTRLLNNNNSLKYLLEGLDQFKEIRIYKKLIIIIINHKINHKIRNFKE